MIELRWKLESHFSNHPDAKWTLQYRYIKHLVYDPAFDPTMTEEWSDWIDVPYYSGE